MMNFNHIIVPIWEFEENYCYANNAFKKLSIYKSLLIKLAIKLLAVVGGRMLPLRGWTRVGLSHGILIVRGSRSRRSSILRGWLRGPLGWRVVRWSIGVELRGLGWGYVVGRGNTV